MNKHTIYFVDDDERERRGCLDVLVELLGNDEVTVSGMAPTPNYTGFAALLNDPGTGAFILDYKLGSTGLVTYSGTDLAGYLRGISQKIPIVILTNYQSEITASEAPRVEDIVEKNAILRDPTAQKAQTFKARLLRHINVFSGIRDERENRFHELLVKSLRERLTADEEKELGILETNRTLPMQAEEISSIAELEKALDEVRARVRPGGLEP